MLRYEDIDLLLGESLELMVKAAEGIKDLAGSTSQKKRMHIGRACSELWEVRAEIYNQHPEIKRDFVKESSDDPQRYEELNSIHLKALKEEKNKQFEQAQITYSELLKQSHYGYFKLLAEAGIYRVSIGNKT